MKLLPLYNAQMEQIREELDETGGETDQYKLMRMLLDHLEKANAMTSVLNQNKYLMNSKPTRKNKP